MSVDDNQAEVPLTSIRVETLRQQPYSADTICCAAHKIRKYLMNNIILIMTLGGVLVGLAVGLAVRTIEPSRDVLMWIGMPGELFLRLLKLMILPLIVCSVVSGTANLDPRSNGKISLVAFIFIVATNILACAIAIALSVAIHPGRPGIQGTEKTTSSFMQTQDIFADLLRNLAPDNIVEACFKQAQTRYTTDTEYIERNTTNATYTDMIVTGTRTVVKTDGVNVLGLILACGVIGIAANVSKERGKAFLDFFSSATDVVLIVLRWFMWIGPIGISSLIAVAMASIQDIEETFSRLGMFMVTVTVGIVLHQIVVMPIIFFVITRRNPFAFIVSIFRAWLLGFATTSAAVAIPEMIVGCEKQKVDPRIARVVIPFCVTINADGSALYITSAAIFIAQSLGTPVSAGDLVTIGILTAIAAMAIPAVPSASIVTLVIILTSLNIPADDIALLFAVEWYLIGPIGISSLIAVAMASIQDIEETFSRLGMFMVTVTVGIVLHQIVVMPIIFFVITRRNPFAFIVSIFRAWLLGFATTSAAVAIPEMIVGCEKQKVDPRIARVVIPFCVTINADGSALYITSAAIFIAQSLGTPVSAGDLVTIGILTAIAAMAIPAVPSASIVTLVIILTSLNIPADDIALLFAVEWYLDRIRTTSNIISHTFTAAVTHHFCKGNLKNVDEAQDRGTEISENMSPIVKHITSRVTSL